MTPKDSLYRAISREDVAEVRGLIHEHPDLMKVFLLKQSWLHLAAEDGNIEIMQALVEAGIPVDQLTPDGPETPLETAAGLGGYKACIWLLDHGADINHGLGKVATPIFSAIYSRSLELVKLFVDRGADLSATFGKGPKIDVIHFAKENGSPEILKFLKEQIGRKKA